MKLREHLDERGFGSIFGIVLLGVMMLGGAGLAYAVRNDATASMQYEDEVRLRLAAESAVERAALSFERGGARAGMDADDLGDPLVLVETEPEPGMTCRVTAQAEQGEIILSATTSKEPQGRRFAAKASQRACAHLGATEEGGYVWLGWIP